jgi:hypothetical protein
MKTIFCDTINGKNVVVNTVENNTDKLSIMANDMFVCFADNMKDNLKHLKSFLICVIK